MLKTVNKKVRRRENLHIILTNKIKLNDYPNVLSLKLLTINKITSFNNNIFDIKWKLHETEKTRYKYTRFL